MSNSACSSCSAPIVWTTTENGKRMPVDAEPVPAGTILLRHLEVGKPPVAHVTTRAERAQLDEQLKHRDPTATLLLFVSHFASCPNAETHRRAA